MSATVKLAAAGAVLLVPVSPVLVASPAAADCVPSVSLAAPFTDTTGQTHLMASFDTCGKAMMLKFKSRAYKKGHYELFAAGPAQGFGTVETVLGGCTEDAPQKAQWLVALKVGTVLQARSTARTYTIPFRPCDR